MGVGSKAKKRKIRRFGIINHTFRRVADADKVIETVHNSPANTSAGARASEARRLDAVVPAVRSNMLDVEEPERDQAPVGV